MATAALAALTMAGATPGQTAPNKPAEPAGDLVRGETVYEAKCGGCHSVDSNRIGPMHRGVVGRRAAAIKGYTYSPALRKSGLIWTPATLDRWLKGPTKLVPGTRMGLVLADATDRRDVIAYLANQRPLAR